MSFRSRPHRAHPSLATAAAASLCIHVGVWGAVILLEWWMFAAANRAEFSGKRNVVQIELAWSAPSSAEPVLPVTIEPPTEQEPRDREPIAPDSIAPATVPATVAAELQIVRVEESLAEAARQAVEPPTPAQAHHTAPLVTPSRRAEAVPPLTTSVDPKLIRRSTPTPAPSVPQVATPQVAGTDDRTAPDLSGNRKPDYPLAAYRNGIEGVVLLRLEIDATGRVKRVSIEQSSGHNVLDRAAVAAVRTWSGRPAHRGGRPVATEEILPVHFRIPRR